MKTTVAIALAVASLAATACDSGGGGATTAATPAPAASPPPPPPPPPPAPAVTAMPGLSVPFATEAEWLAGCTGEAKIDAGICDCVVKATVKEIGVKGLYTWVWEGYVQRSGMGQVRSKKWFTDNGIDSAGQQKFADAVGKCYVTQ